MSSWQPQPSEQIATLWTRSMWWRYADSCVKSGSLAEMQKPLPSSDPCPAVTPPSSDPALQWPLTCEAWGRGCWCCCAPSGASSSSTHWLHVQWLRMSIPFPSLGLLMHVTDTQARTAAGVTSSFAGHCWILLQGDFICPWTGHTLARYRPDALKNHLKMFWASLLAFPLKKKPNSCVSCLTKLLPWQLVVENTTQRIISHWNWVR